MKKQCSHIFTKGAHKDEQCPKQPRRGDYCYTHKKSISTAKSIDLNSDPIFGQNKPMPISKSKEKYSIWRFTLNSQQVFDKMTDAKKRTFKNFIEFVFSEDRITDFLADRTSPNDSKLNILKLKTTWYYEVGDLQGRLHIHGIIDLTHTGMYYLQANAIRELGAKILGHNIHFNSPVFGNLQLVWERYISKKQSDKVIQLE